MCDKTSQHIGMVIQKGYLLAPSARLQPEEAKSMQNIRMYLEEYVTRLEEFDNNLYNSHKIIDKLTLLTELSCQLCTSHFVRHGSFEESGTPTSRPQTSHRASRDYFHNNWL